MTQKDKELLLKDLCARLPYGVKVRSDGIPHEQTLIYFLPDIEHYNIKPYLRPMSSMSEEEESEYWTELHSKAPDIPIGKEPTFNDVAKEATIVIDWLNKKGFDYRGLIPMGLAFEAPEDMYKN